MPSPPTNYALQHYASIANNRSPRQYRKIRSFIINNDKESPSCNGPYKDLHETNDTVYHWLQYDLDALPIL